MNKSGKPKGNAKILRERRPYASPAHIKIRWTLAGLLVALVVITSVFGFKELVSASREVTQLGNVTLNENITQLIDIKREASGKVFDIAVLVGAAIFALFIAKKDEAKIVFGDVPEVIMFGAAVVLLAASILCNVQYQDLLADALLLGRKVNSIPNIFHSAFEAFYSWQWLFLVAGVVAAAITLFSAHRLKGNDDNDVSQQPL